MKTITLQQAAELIKGNLQGPGDIEICDIRGLDSISEGCATFAENAETVKSAENIPGVKAIIVPESLTSELPFITVKNPRVAFALLLDFFHPRPKHAPGIHPQACVAKDASVHPSAFIGPFCCVESGAAVKEHAEMEAGSSLGAGSELGCRSRLMPGAQIGAHSIIGSDCLIGAHTQAKDGINIGDDVEIGARCLLGACAIGNGCRIDNMAIIKDGARIGAFSIIISQANIGKKAELGQFTISASQSVVKDGVKIGNGAQLGGRSIASHDIPPGQMPWAGDPAVPYKDYMRGQAAIQKLAKMRRQLAKAAALARKRNRKS